MKKAILAKIEAHFSVLVRQDFVLLYDFKTSSFRLASKEEEGLDSTSTSCSAAYVIDWVEQGHDGWDDDTPWECFFLMPPYGFPAYIAPNRSADIRLPCQSLGSARSIGCSSSEFRFHNHYPTPKTKKTSEDDSPSPPQSRKASRALNPLPGVGPPSSSGNHRSRKDDNEKRLSRGPTAVPKLNVAGGDNPSPWPSGLQSPSRLKEAAHPVIQPGQIQSPSSNSKATPKTGGTVRPGSSSKPLLVPVAKTKELFESERPPKRRRLAPQRVRHRHLKARTSSMEKMKMKISKSHILPVKREQCHQKSRTGGVDMKEEKEDVEAMPLSSSVKRSSRKRKQKVDDDNAEADDNTFEAPKPKPSKKRKNKKGKKKEDSPEVAAIDDSKGPAHPRCSLS
ncbi:hypothetical protein BKA70DRAFT_1234140 [Coprinopsis sp. MPI-PUGE-AT-0042]|nr:hypothetical protein BKA70DRAFT_1234140 [Coprinopsis sp. MPI-PUGE-AT-0042]